MYSFNLPDNELIDTLLPLAESMEEGWNQKNYDMFINNAAAEAKEAFTISHFNKEIERSYDKLGKHTIQNVVMLHKNPDNIIVIWKVKYEKRKEPGLLIYHFEERNNKIVISGSTNHA